MPQVRLSDELAELVRDAEPDAESLARAVEAVLLRGLAFDPAAPDPSSEVEKPEPPVSHASVRRPKRGSLWPT